LLILMAVVFLFSTAFASTNSNEAPYIFSDPSGNTLNYVGNDDSLTFGSNVFHQRAVTGNVILPITWRWNQWIGPSMSQPVVVPLPPKNPDSPSGGVVFTLGGNKVYAIDLETGNILDSKTFQSSSTPTGSSITYFQGNLYFGTRDGSVASFKYDFQTNKLIKNWITNISQSEIGRISSTPIFMYSYDPNSRKPKEERNIYIAAGSWDGHMYFLDAQTGTLVKSLKMSGPVTGSPAVVANGDIVPTTYIVGVDGGYPNLSGGYFDINGTFYFDTNTTNVNSQVKAGPIASSVALKWESYTDKNGVTKGVTFVFFADVNGILYAYDRNTGKLLWKITQFKGTFINNTPTVGDGYVYFTTTNPAKVITVDYWTGKVVSVNPLPYTAYSGSTLVNIYDPTLTLNIKGLLSTDQAGNMFIADAEDGSALPAFFDPNSPDILTNVIKLSNAGGTYYGDYQHPEITYAHGWLLVAYNGILQAFSSFPGTDFAVEKLYVTSNGQPVSYLIPGRSYTINAEFTGLFWNSQMDGLDRVPYYVEVNGTRIYEGTINFRPSDPSVYFVKIDMPPVEFTTPSGVSEAVIDVVINPIHYPKEYIPDIKGYQKTRSLNLVEDYTNNYKKITLPIGSKIDLYAKSITNQNPVDGQKYYNATVVVGNNSDVPIKRAEVQFTVNGVMQFADHDIFIDLAPHEEKTLTFRWISPPNNDVPQGKIVTLGAVINPNKVIDEDNYNNNAVYTNVKVNYVSPLPQTHCQSNWTEQRPDEYIPPEYDNKGNLIRGGYWTYKTVAFYNKLNVTAKIITDHDPYRSGYGFYLDVKTSIETNYDNLSAIKGATKVVAYMQDGSVIELEPKYPPGTLENEWQLPPNPQSIYNNRKYFTDPHQPDGPFVVYVYAFGAGKDGDLVCRDIQSVQIVGSMYDDDATVITK
ncbi:PQQ-binding-like beta-propeller repeat protein, partial [Caldanaerobacter subterraneus]|uniref:outer membrane protein assembly factor BamB family protein n=1 Tax=Caldanaerobacter subterraneus TaxID=911092 RepID=UPI001982462C